MLNSYTVAWALVFRGFPSKPNLRKLSPFIPGERKEIFISLVLALHQHLIFLVLIKDWQIHHAASFPSWLFSFDEHNERWSEGRLISFSYDGQPWTLMTFSHSILISKRRCFRRFDEVRAVHFPAQRGPFRASPLVLTLRDNHIGDLSLGPLLLSLSPGCTSSSCLNRKGINSLQPHHWNRKTESIWAHNCAELEGRLATFFAHATTDSWRQKPHMCFCSRAVFGF